MTTQLLIAFDPGETIGVAVISLDEDRKFQTFARLEHVRHEVMPQWLADLDASIAASGATVTDVVYERFITYRQHAQRQVGSKQVTSQVIGMIKMWASHHKIVPFEQGADVLSIGYKWSGIKKPGRHSETHRFDAAAHGYYFLTKNNRATPIGVTPILTKETNNG